MHSRSFCDESATSYRRSNLYGGWMRGYALWMISPALQYDLVLTDEKRHRGGMRNAPSMDEHRWHWPVTSPITVGGAVRENPVGIGPWGDGICEPVKGPRLHLFPRTGPTSLIIHGILIPCMQAVDISVRVMGPTVGPDKRHVTNGLQFVKGALLVVACVVDLRKMGLKWLHAPSNLAPLFVTS